MTDVVLKGGKKLTAAKVTDRGQVVVAPLDFSIPSSISLVCASTAYNFAAPKSNKIFIITDIIISSGSGASQIVDLYEANSETSLTVQKQIFNLDMSAKTYVPLTGLNWKLTQGFWLNAKSNGTTAMVTIAGYIADA